MLSPYGLGIIESCITCGPQSGCTFCCDLPVLALQELEDIKVATVYPKDAILFVEGQAPRGIFALCKGRVKLSMCAQDGKTLIVRIVQPGEILGLGATVSGHVYGLTAETVEPCLVSFVTREDFLRFLKQHPEACFKVAQHLSEKYHSACVELRTLGLSHSAGEKLARLILDWSSQTAEAAKHAPSLDLSLSHEEMAQMIGTSRETVSRLFAEMRQRRIIQGNGSRLVIRNKGALKLMATEKHIVSRPGGGQ